ncbi:hypothetical protein TrVGV298_008040 [Trichoderma virens]|nr:hypothetical protein TrVGV298_008040 [Trichoderma virens]
MSGIVACRSCRQRKRRCDKGLPACGLCRRMGRVCEYQLDNVDPAPSATAAEIEALRNRLDRMERRLASGPTTTNTTTPSSDNGSLSSWPLSTSAAPSVSAHQFDLQNDPSVPTTALFLDLDVFVWARCSLPPPNISAVPIPTDILTVLTQGGSVVDASNNYFSTVHRWLPFISRRRMDLGFSIREAGPELAMLFFSMKLITTKIEDDASTDTGAHYLSAKGFLDTLQLNNAVSLICLQSMILVALYEFSHAVYPAAWMTLGACARYAEILGLSCSEAKTSPLNPPMSWTEAEERRRAWWVIFVLDRLLSAGGRRSFLLPDPPSEGRLPGNDEAWESGDVREAVGFPVSTDKHVPQYNFARLCQSAIYIGRCVDCARTQRSGSRSSTFIDEVSSLIEELNDFAGLLDSATEGPGKGPFTNPLAPSFLARSSLFILLDVLTCPEKVSSDAGYAVSPQSKIRR